MNVLLVGSGGREHAIAWKLRQSPKVERLWCAPGNGGIAGVAECVDIAARDIQGIVNFARANAVDLTFVAPDDPLADGMVDALEAAGCPAFGPSGEAAQIEASKTFGKYIMAKYGIPTGKSRTFIDAAAAREYIRQQGAPIVVKADGLALGKGVFVCMKEQEALDAVDEVMVRGAFGDAGRSVVVEEFLEGPEVSLLCFADGASVAVMPPAQDYKRVFDGDRGPNTGGMGAFAPSPKLSAEELDWAKQNVLQRAVEGMDREGRPFKGVLYAGLILTREGIKVLEFNARFGDPETQALLPLLKTDLVEIIEAVRSGRLNELDIEWSNGAAATVVMASGGYPGTYRKGYPISGIEDAEALPGVKVFHSGTKQTPDGPVTGGGRVLGVTAVADTLTKAALQAYAGAGRIRFADSHMRLDIGGK